MKIPEADSAKKRTGSAWPFDIRRFGKSLLGSDLFQTIAAAGLGGFFALTYRLNRDTGESTDAHALLDGEWPVIFALWHGQQLLIPYAAPKDQRFASLVSRSTDAEINARVIERAGHQVIRGSGGRVRRFANRKGGVKAMLSMRDALRAGTNIVMIADISKGAPRQAGEGIVRLAKLTGRPIVPMALATSRNHVVRRSWDQTTINLPFGRRCLRLGDPIHVAADADDAGLEIARLKVTADLDRVTGEARTSVGQPS